MYILITFCYIFFTEVDEKRFQLPHPEAQKKSIKGKLFSI